MNPIIGITVGTPVPPAANAIKGSVSGNPILIDDVSPLKHEIAVGLKSKNLCPSQEYGVHIPLFIPKGTTITASSGNTLADNMSALFYDENKKRIESDAISLFYSSTDGRSYGTKTLSQDVHYMMWGWANVANVIDGQLEIGTTATAYTPFVDFKQTHIKGELVTTSAFATEYFEVNSTMYSTVLEVNKDELVFYNKVWKGSGKLLDGVYGDLSDYFSAGDMACITKATEDGRTVYHLSKASLVDKTVKKYGKNLVDASMFVGDALVKNADGTYTITKTASGRFSKKAPLLIPKGTPFLITPQNIVDNAPLKSLCVQIHFADGTQDTFGFTTGGEYYKTRPVSGRTKDTVAITLYIDFTEEVGASYSFSDIQIELGKEGKQTDFEPYVEPTTYTADENGNVAVPSLYPTTVLMADEGVIATAEYQKDSNKVIESLVNAIISLGGNI